MRQGRKASLYALSVIVWGMMQIGTIPLFSSIALGDDKDDFAAKVAKAKKVYDEVKKVYDEETEEIIKKLPPSAVVLVLDCVLDTNIDRPKLSKEQFAQVKEKFNRHYDSVRSTCQPDLVKKFLARGLKVVDRAVMKEAEKEIVLSQTGVVDPKTGVQFGKATGATHIVIEKGVATLRENSIRFVESTTVTELQSALVVGIASAKFDKPVKVSQPRSK